jgi:tetratricopeptide (TPR) repeat protein
VPDFDGVNIDLNINTYGGYLFFIVNGKWIGEINDTSLKSGTVGFVLASYETENRERVPEGEYADNEYGYASASSGCTCRAWLDYFKIDARNKTIEEKYNKWTDEANVNAEGRLRLAETFAVMGKSSKGMEQLLKAWKRRDDAISASVQYTEVRTKKELLLASRMSFDLGQYGEAEKYVDLIIEQWANSEEGKFAVAEKVKILNELNKFKELKEFVLEHSDALGKDIDYYTMLGRCHFELGEYKESAEAWKKAFKINGLNGVYAVNAANALEQAGKKEKSLALYLEAGKLFLKEDNQAELLAMMPRLSALGGDNWEVRALSGKWAYSIEDYDRCGEEFAAAEKLRRAIKPRPEADGAVFYLWGLVLSVKGKNEEAVRLLEKAVKLAPDYGLFRFKLAEIKLLSGVEDHNIVNKLKAALKFCEDADGSMASHAADILSKAGYSEEAKYFTARAANRQTPAGN